MADPKFQSSFIPKNTTLSGGELPQKRSLSLYGIGTVILFVISVLALGGVFAYKKMTESAVADLEDNVATTEASLDKNAINNIVDFDKRIKAIKQIVENHVALSGYLNMLEKNTITGMQFLTLKYNAPDSSSNLDISMDGKSLSYAALAEEQAVLEKNPDTVSVSFENMALDQNTSGISFTLKAIFKGDLSKWSNLLPKQNAVTPPSTSKSSKTATSTSSATSTDVSASDINSANLPDLNNF